jgi:hypothetical protein
MELDFDKLYKLVSDEKNIFEDSIKASILDAFRKGEKCTEKINPDENGRKWSDEIVEKLQKSGFKVCEHCWSGVYTYEIKWR